jgi:hypothetical protein
VAFHIAVRGPFEDSVGNKHYIVYLAHRLLADATHKGLQHVLDGYGIPLSVSWVLGVETEVNGGVLGTGGVVKFKAKKKEEQNHEPDKD